MLSGIEPDDIVAYTLVTITKDNHVRVASEDPHDTCVAATLIDGLQVLNMEMQDGEIGSREIQSCDESGKRS